MRIKFFWSRKAVAAEAYSKGFVDGATMAVESATREKDRRRPDLEEIEQLEQQFREQS